MRAQWSSVPFHASAGQLLSSWLYRGCGVAVYSYGGEVGVKIVEIIGFYLKLCLVMTLEEIDFVFVEQYDARFCRIYTNLSRTRI